MLTKNDFQGATLVDALFDGTVEENDFKGANLTRASFTVEVDDNDFTGANLTGALISREVLKSDFRGADLTGATLTGSFMLNDFSYANLADSIPNYSYRREAPNDFSNAWWVDGRRCGLDVGRLLAGECLEREYDSGLTYEEWKNGETDVSKSAAKIMESVQQFLGKF